MLAARPISLEDIQLPAPPADIVTRMRSSHHAAARMLAEGKRPGEVAAVTGYSQSTISVLQRDPAFANLVALYQENVQAIYVDTHQRMDSLAGDAVDVLHERLREKPDEFTVPQLESLARTFLDRVGFGPSKTINQTTLSAQVTPDDLARIRAQTASRGEVRQLAEAPSASSGGLDQRNATPLPALVHSPVTPAQEVEGGGVEVRAQSDGVAGE